MRRFADVFIFLCILVVAISLGVILRLQFDASMVGTVLSIAALVGVLYLIHRETSRRRQRDELAQEVTRIGEYLQRLSEDVIALERRVSAGENGMPRRARDEIEPLAAEVEVIGGLVKQVVETVADLEMRLGDITARPVPQAYAPQYAPQPAPMPQPVPQPVPQPIAQPAFAPPPQQGWVPAPASAPLVFAPDGYVGQPQAAPAVQPPRRADAIGAAAVPLAPQVAPAAAPRENLVPKRFTHLDERAFLDLVRRAIDQNRIDVHLQPIVTLPQRKVRFYEALTRLRAEDGETIYPSDYLPLAEMSGLVAPLDNQILLRSVQLLRRLSQRTRDIGIFVNLSTTSLADASFFKDFVGFLEQNRNLADMLIFEFAQRSVRSMGPIEFEALKGLYDLGFRFSLDQITDLKISFQNLFERGFRYAKISSDRLLTRSEELGTDIHPADLANYFQRFGIDLIADHVETESQVVDILDFGIGYGQGFLFSPPRPVRPETFGAGLPEPGTRPPEISAPARGEGGRGDAGRGEARRPTLVGPRAGGPRPVGATAGAATPVRR
ncbi:EAL domain-containing protein [Methyloraptor flagellatus]|uniref:EAL domain-containing protein n=1 Tax=Methyloraptor flagellatus TaxID=3162530 RepID=A0AAU7X612_9HYPH